MESHDISIKNDGISLEITHSLTINKDWMNCVLSKSIKEDTNLFEEYYKTLKNFRKKLSNNNEARFPINFERKLELLVNKFSLSKEVKTDLDPKTILLSYDELVKKCENNKYIPGNELLKYMLYAYAGPKALICKYRVTMKTFYILQKILKII